MPRGHPADPTDSADPGRRDCTKCPDSGTQPDSLNRVRSAAFAQRENVSSWLAVSGVVDSGAGNVGV
jgi:hypothetical protein